MPTKTFLKSAIEQDSVLAIFFFYHSSGNIQSDFALGLSMESVPKLVNLVISSSLIGMWDMATLNRNLSRYTHSVT